MGVVGLGQGAAQVLPTLYSLPETQLVAGADPNERMRAGLLERFPGTRAYDSLEALCKDPEIEAIWVATPNRFHCEHALTAMRSGKHVIVEKPMAMNPAECNKMIEASQKAGKKLAVGFQYRYHPNSQYLERVR